MTGVAQCIWRLRVDLSRSTESFSSLDCERLGRVLDQIPHCPKQPPLLPPLRDRRHAPPPVLEAVLLALGRTGRRSPVHPLPSNGLLTAGDRQGAADRVVAPQRGELKICVA